MDKGMLEKVTALREEAYATLKALDTAVVSLGGQPRVEPRTVVAVGTASGTSSTNGVGVSRRLSQSGAAEVLLRERGEPMTGADLLTALPTKGVTMLGPNRLVNFTSAMSKSGKFRSERRDGSYFWWFKDEPLPPKWNEAPDLLERQPGASSVHSNQEGGEGHGPATT